MDLESGEKMTSRNLDEKAEIHPYFCKGVRVSIPQKLSWEPFSVSSGM